MNWPAVKMASMRDAVGLHRFLKHRQNHLRVNLTQLLRFLSDIVWDLVFLGLRGTYPNISRQERDARPTCGMMRQKKGPSSRREKRRQKRKRERERDRHRNRANQRSNTCNRPTTQTHLDNTYQMIRDYVLSSLAHIELLAFGILGV